MPPDLPNEQALNLKKRARRRLVGAIALVLLMVIVLPQVLQDRAAMTQLETIKITMPDTNSTFKPMHVDKSAIEFQQSKEVAPQQGAVVSDEPIKAEVIINTEPTIESIIASKDRENKVTELKKPTVNVSETTLPQKLTEHFTVQVGVYSDVANVKRIQDQLKQAGFSTYTEKITTPKGENIRLKAGNFTSRQDAVNVLVKLKEIGLPGIVVSNE
jgi:DedD protein